MSKASEYARIMQEAKAARAPAYKEPMEAGRASSTGDGDLYCDGIWKDPLALARWIVETWGEPTPDPGATNLVAGRCEECGKNVKDLRVWACRYLCPTCYDNAEHGRALHVSPTGEITGTLPCGHDTRRIILKRDDSLVCITCEGNAAGRARSPAP